MRGNKEGSIHGGLPGEKSIQSLRDDTRAPFGNNFRAGAPDDLKFNALNIRHSFHILNLKNQTLYPPVNSTKGTQLGKLRFDDRSSHFPTYDESNNIYRHTKDAKSVNFSMIENDTRKKNHGVANEQNKLRSQPMQTLEKNIIYVGKFKFRIHRVDKKDSSSRKVLALTSLVPVRGHPRPDKMRYLANATDWDHTSGFIRYPYNGSLNRKSKQNITGHFGGQRYLDKFEENLFDVPETETRKNDIRVYITKKLLGDHVYSSVVMEKLNRNLDHWSKGENSIAPVNGNKIKRHRKHVESFKVSLFLVRFISLLQCTLYIHCNKKS